MKEAQREALDELLAAAENLVNADAVFEDCDFSEIGADYQGYIRSDIDRLTKALIDFEISHQNATILEAIAETLYLVPLAIGLGWQLVFATFSAWRRHLSNSTGYPWLWRLLDHSNLY